MDALRLKVLGGLQVQLREEKIGFSRNKTTALLVFLAVTGEGQSRDAFATMFWPENTQPGPIQKAEILLISSFKRLKVCSLIINPY